MNEYELFEMLNGMEITLGNKSSSIGLKNGYMNDNIIKYDY